MVLQISSHSEELPELDHHLRQQLRVEEWSWLRDILLCCSVSLLGKLPYEKYTGGFFIVKGKEKGGGGRYGQEKSEAAPCRHSQFKHNQRIRYDDITG